MSNESNIGKIWVTILTGVVLIGIVVLAIAAIFDGRDENQAPPDNGVVNGNNQPGQNGDQVTDQNEWVSFDDNDYNVSLNYPKQNWSVYVDKSQTLEPKINVYLTTTSSEDLPYNHFTNANHVSVFPRGIPTEGLIASSTKLDFNAGFEVSDQSRMFVLDDGTPFAAYIIPANPPLSWNESGFIWLRLEIDDMERRCLRQNQEVPADECNPLEDGSEIVWYGEVDESIWETEKEILASMELSNIAGPNDLITVWQPMPNTAITSPLTINGQARGTWYFEASFPVVLTDWDGRIIAESHAQAQDDWMTEDFVPFSATLNFDSPYKEGDPAFMQNGTLILQKDNPSGLPENDDAVEIPVKFE